jgi:hypothetical protein
MASLAIKNRHLVGLCTWLQGLALAGKESRERTRFVDLCIPRISELEGLKGQVVEKYCLKNEDGSRKTIEKDGRIHWDIPADQEAAFRKDLEELENEEFLIDLLDGNISKVNTVRNLVLNTDFKFGPAEEDDEAERDAKVRLAHDYSEWCIAFETLEA